ncbi:MAG: ATP-dependent helicase HrpB [Magnetospiraceae bacterium]
MHKPLPPLLAELPISCALFALQEHLELRANAVVIAPPGAGKTTAVPLALLAEGWAKQGKIIVLEPRRIAARAAARRMAEILSEKIGETVGFRTRNETRIGANTRIEVITEGILTRLLLADPALEGIAAIIFDEVHERHLHGDIGLALCLETQSVLRPDLRLIAMSATVDGNAFSSLLNAAAPLVSEGKSYPVETSYFPRRQTNPLENDVAAAIRQAVIKTEGGILVFLPGAREIQRVEQLVSETIKGNDILLAPLYGALPPAAQDRAIAPAPPGKRKIVLATDIVETSLTISDIRVVIDAGYARNPRFDPRRGLSRLITERVSKASAEQRQGRAGRVAPGVCYRLWAEPEHRSLPEKPQPEILEADLTAMMLVLAQWGVRDPATLTWMDPPPAAAVARARECLVSIGAVSETGAITPHGAELGQYPLHPRLAHMVLRATMAGHGDIGRAVAALLSEDDVLAGEARRQTDLRLRVDALYQRGRSLPVRQGTLQNARKLHKALAKGPKKRETAPAGNISVGELVSLAFPEWISRRRGAETRYHCAGGMGAALPPEDPFLTEEWLAVAEMSGGAGDARIRLAAPLTLDGLKTWHGHHMVEADEVFWNSREERVTARRVERLDALVLWSRPLDTAAPEDSVSAMIDGIRKMGLAALPWTKTSQSWRDRVAFLHGLETGNSEEDAWPDVSDAALLAELEDWLGPFLGGAMRREHLAKLNLMEALRTLLPWHLQQRLDQEAPTHVTVPSGRTAAIDYRTGTAPVLAVKLQEMFGAGTTPTIAGGRVPLTLHLLSPAGRPLQVTRDLPGFWAGAYAEVRKDMRGRYPKHPWPEDPTTAIATHRTKKAQR